MYTNEINIKKICSFYVSDWHLTAMLLPYITNKLQKNERINTILNKDIKEKMEELLSRINIEENEKEKVKSINWKNNYIYTYEEIDNYMKKVVKKDNKNIIIISGNKEEIENTNKNIDKWIIKNISLLKNISINIINCYDVEDFNNNLKSILEKHDFILNTSGEHEIGEMFAGFNKKNVS